MSRRPFIYSVIYGLRTDDLDGTSTVSINTAETTQRNECSTIIGVLQERRATIFWAILLRILHPKTVGAAQGSRGGSMQGRVGCAP